MTPTVIEQVTWLVLAGVLAPLLVEGFKRFAIPGVVMEILLGIVLGPQLLHLVTPTGVVLDVSNLGLALLMFLAGYELDLRVIRGRPVARAAISWLGSGLVALVVAVVLIVAGHPHGEIVIGLCLTTTALGTLLPVLRDSGILQSSFGRDILAVGSIGEFAPIVLIALLLGGTNPGLTVLLLIGFGSLAALFALTASRPWGQRITMGLRRGLNSSSQLPVRVSMLLIVALVLLATRLGLDVLLGAFAAGIIVRVAVAGHEDHAEIHAFRGKLEAIGFGMFVPIFFIVSGTRLNLDAFVHHPTALLAIVVFFALMLLGRGLPILIGYRRALPHPQRFALALFAATGLPLIVVITTIGTANGYIAAPTAAALVTAGMLSVLLLPALGLRVLAGDVAADQPSFA
jgi:Kef-type K+ transport system membrane component KefB